MTRTFNLLASLMLVMLLWLGSACQSMANYPPESAPLFTANFAPPPPAATNQIKLVTWNIKFAEQIDTAIAELRSTPELQNADILLLQEMDETGAETIARQLGYNYVYYPASIHSYHGRNFGNAILSRWPITQPAIVGLPFENPKNRQRRAASQATVTVGTVELLVFSTHTETIWLDRRKRLAQVEKLVTAVDPAAPITLVGGDFNTATQRSIIDLEQLFAAGEMDRLSADAGHTVEKSGLEFTLDHVFGHGVTVIDLGVARTTTASDHFPLWLELSLEPTVAE